MKEIKYILFVALSISVATFSYSQTSRQLLIKKWLFKEVDSKDVDAMVAKLIEKRNKEFEGITDSVKKAEKVSELKKQAELAADNVNKIFSGLEFEFKRDGTCETGGRKDKKIEKGNWTFSNDGKKIFIANDQNNKQEFTIIKLTFDELTIGMPSGSGSIHLTFDRSKTPKEMITRKWIFIDFETKNVDESIAIDIEKRAMREVTSLDSLEKVKMYNEMKKQLLQMDSGFHQEIKFWSLEFRSDSTFSWNTNFKKEKAKKGEWDISKDGKILTLYTNKNYEIIKLTNNEMILSSKAEETDNNFIFILKPAE